jgi:hypothetical protein
MAKKAFIFLNCDEDKSPASMNVLYNNEAFSDTKTGRRALLKKVQQEAKEKRIFVEDGHDALVKESVLNGDPSEATSDLMYGAIVEIEVH